MKSIPSFVLLFICFIGITQQVANLPNAIPWMAPYYPFSFNPAYPIYHGLYGRNSLTDPLERYRLTNQQTEDNEPRSRYRPYQLGDDAADVSDDIAYFPTRQQFDRNTVYSGSGDLNVYPFDYQRKWEQSPSGRFLGSGINLGTGASANNYLLKTSFVFVTSKATLCFATSCIPAALFAIGSSNVICARRKRELDSATDISPSNTEKVEPTASLTLGDIKFDEHPSGRSSSPILFPSFAEDGPQESGSSVFSENDTERNKRFLFILTTTVMTYSFATSTYTSTLSPAAAGALTCRPSGIALC